jgi:hypothetical protein
MEDKASHQEVSLVFFSTFEPIPLTPDSWEMAFPCSTSGRPPSFQLSMWYSMWYNYMISLVISHTISYICIRYRMCVRCRIRYVIRHRIYDIVYDIECSYNIPDGLQISWSVSLSTAYAMIFKLQLLTIVCVLDTMIWVATYRLDTCQTTALATHFILVRGQSYAWTASPTPYKSIVATLPAWRGPHRLLTQQFSWGWRRCAIKIPLIQPPGYHGKIILLHPKWCSEAHWHLWRESAQFIGPEAINMVRDYIHFLCKKTLCFSPGGTGYEA